MSEGASSIPRPDVLRAGDVIQARQVQPGDTIVTDVGDHAVVDYVRMYAGVDGDRIVISLFPTTEVQREMGNGWRLDASAPVEIAADGGAD